MDAWVKDQVLWPDNQPAAGRRTAVILSNCTGRGLGDYLLTQEEFRGRFVLHRLEIGPILLCESKGIPIVATQRFQDILGSADLLITNNTGERHGALALSEIERRLKTSCGIVTFVATNFGPFWPIAYGYGGFIGVHAMLDDGAKRKDVWEAFKNGTFDPQFNIRWRMELGRMVDRETFHDIGYSSFIQAHYKQVKLFLAQSHPGAAIVAYIGSQILKTIGLTPETDEKILSYDCTKFAVGPQPETEYEFKHFGFKYPRRFVGDADKYYNTLLDGAVESWKGGGIIPPTYDT